MKNLKKVFAILLTLLFAVPSGVSFAEDASYEVLYDLNYENISSGTTNCWDYADGGKEGTRTFFHGDGFSGDTSIKMATNEGGYACFWPHRGWDGSDYKIYLTQGKTYIMSYKIKKIPADKKVDFNALKDAGGEWIWGLGAKFKPADTGWRTVSHTFTVGTAPSGTGDVLTGVPLFYYISPDVKGGDALLIDDFKTVQINDTSILDGTDPTAEVSGLSTAEMTVTFSQEMSDDVLNPKAYIIDGAEAQSVTYDASTKTATVIPSTELTPGTDVNVTVSACDYIGRAVYTTTEENVAYPPETVCSTSINESEEEIESIDGVTVSFTNPVNDLTADNFALTSANAEGTIASVDKLDNKTYRVNFNSFLKAGEYTLNITGVTDVYGRAVGAKSIDFKVKKITPSVVSATPSDGTGDLPAGSMNVSVSFNKNIDAETASGISADNGAEVENISVSDNVVTFTLTKLEAGSTYTVTLKDLKDTDGETVSETTLTYYTMLEMPVLYKNSFENAAATGETLADTDYRRCYIEGIRTLDTSEYVTGPSGLKAVLTDKNNSDLVPGTGANQDSRIKIQIGKRYRMTFCIKIPDNSDIKNFTPVNGDNKTFLDGRQDLKKEVTPIEGKDGWFRYVYDFTGESQNASDIAKGTVYVPSLRFELKAGASISDKSVFYMDDLELYQYPEVSIADSSVSDNAENVAVDKPIQVIFNGGITNATAKIGNIVCNADVDGNKVTVTPQTAPEYGRYYELELNVTDKYGVASTHKIQFKTETAVKMSDIKVGSEAYTEGMTVSKDNDISITLSAAASRAQEMYGVIAVYDENGYSTAMECLKLNIAANKQSVPVTIDKALLADGKSVKLYLWNSLNKMEIVHNSIMFNLQ